MKKTILFSFAFLLIFFTASAQNLTLSNNEGVFLNDSVVYMQGDTGSLLVIHMYVTNNAATDLEVKVRKRHVSVVPGSEPTICWAGGCAGVGTFVSDPQILTAGLTDSTSFTADYDSKGHQGTSVVIYTFFNTNNANDTVCFIANFTCTPSAGINNNSITANISPAFPNPCSKATYINYNLLENDNTAKVVVADMIGNQIKEIPVAEKEGKIRIDTYDMAEGIYFYSFILDNKVYYTKKLVVSHQ